jgi:hypothetical protein
MTREELNDLERRLVRESYGSISKVLHASPLTTDDLFELIESDSIKVGDSAASLLSRRKETNALISRLIDDRIRTRLGRLRAINTLTMRGASCPEALPAYVHCLDDRSNDVLSGSLFGIVFMRRHDLLPQLRARLEATDLAKGRRELLEKAVKALELDDPFFYSPNYAGGEMWGLEKRSNKWRK